MSDDKLRQQITAETARLLIEGREPRLRRARAQAARSVAGRWVHPDRFPSELEIRGQLTRHADLLRTDSGEEDDAEAERFRHYRRLLEPLAHVMQPRDRHPEGDALYHSLQVFTLMHAASPWDEELLLAALLHDVGKGIDPLDPVEAGLSALAGTITERTAWLIANHADAQRLHDGELGGRAVRRLSEHPDYDGLLLLARCDREGRVPGAVTPWLEEALALLLDLSRMCEGDG